MLFSPPGDCLQIICSHILSKVWVSFIFNQLNAGSSIGIKYQAENFSYKIIIGFAFYMSGLGTIRTAQVSFLFGTGSDFAP